MNKYKLIATVGLFLGLLSLTSMITYGVTGSYWWVEVARQEIARGMILFVLHCSMWIGGVIGFVYLFMDWEPE